MRTSLIKIESHSEDIFVGGARLVAGFFFLVIGWDFYPFATGGVSLLLGLGFLFCVHFVFARSRVESIEAVKRTLSFSS